MRQFVAGVVTSCAILCVVLFVAVEGGLLRTETEGRPTFFPPAPQFIDHGPQRPEWQAFHVVRNGIRRTGMTAWHSIMPDDSIWHVVSFITRTDSLPLAIAERWRRK